MSIAVTSLYAALLGAWFLILSVRVIKGRQDAGVSLGTGEDRALERRIRAHGNFAEYTPLALILMALLELQSAPGLLLHALGLVLLAGRLMHGYALSFTAHSPFRVPGMGLTLLATLLLVIATLWFALT